MISRTMTSLASVALAAAAGCSSLNETTVPAEAAPVPTVVAIARITSVAFERDGEILSVQATVVGEDQVPRVLEERVTKEDDPYKASWATDPMATPVLIDGVAPPSLKPRLLLVHFDSNGGIQSSPLTDDEARFAVFVETKKPGEGTRPWTLVLHLPPPFGRHLAADEPIELDPAQVREVTLAPPPLALRRQEPASPYSSTGPSPAEQLGHAAGTFLGGVGTFLLVVLAIGTAPVWIPVLIIILSNAGHGFSCGRPFRVRGKARTARDATGEDWIVGTTPEVTELTDEERAELGRSWLVEARAEHASIAAFSALSLDLISIGAPPSLVERAHRAGLDEIVHARLCYSLASAYAGRSLGPGAFPEARASRRVGSLDRELARIAVESLADGCLVEGYAAAVAVEARDRAADPTVVSTLRVIARDEARHVALAWSIVEWCVEKGAGEAVASALGGLPDRPSLASAVEDRATFVAHGRLARVELEAIFERTRRAVIERASELLSVTGLRARG
jgi:hypothetical protein